MRGGRVIPYRSGAKPSPMSEADALVRPAFPAPYNGWNARGNLANMSPLEAIIMDNFFPGVQDVSLRRGSISWATGTTGNIRTLIPYSGGAVDRLFAATSSGWYNVTASGAVGAAAVACTNGFWSFVNFANSGGNWIVAVNGVDAAKKYDGTTFSAAAITGVTPANLSYVTAHQRRLWFIEQNTMNLWYLDVEAVEGAALKFPVGSLFKKGGYLVAIGSWTVDSGSGKDDMLVIVTSNGEIAVYGGTDPNSIATWSLIGVYDVARPLGQRPLVDYGGDLLYLSFTGLTPMTKITQSSLLTDADTISYNIDGAFIDAAENYNLNFGWQMLTHKAANMLIVNVPLTSDQQAYQFVMNTITKAWCRFTSWNASCWAAFKDGLYFAEGTTVTKAWTGVNDAGAPIVGKIAQAYNNLGMGAQKNITLVRPNIAFSAPINLQLSLDADFRTFSGASIIGYAPISGAAIWDLDLWDAGIWDGGGQILNPTWTTVPGELGYLHSLRMQISSSQAVTTWTSTDYAYRRAGVL